MSVISKNRATRSAAYNDFYKVIQETGIEERKVINEMLDLLRQTKEPLTAAQISEALKFKISVPEVAGNLTMMAWHPTKSRYWDARHRVNIPDLRSHERITCRSGCRRATVVEVDKNGNAISSPREILLSESTRYKIEED